MNPNQLLDPAQLATISDFHLLARAIAGGFLAGLHRSLSHGHGTEFFQYRPYTQGEDLKFVDWKVYARRNELVSKTFEEETNTACYFVLDTSASMGYQGGRAACGKLRYASMAVAALAYLAQRQGDSIGLVTYDAEIRHWLEPRYRLNQFKIFLQVLSRLQAAGRAEHRHVWKTLIPRLPGRGMVIFLSDMLEAEDVLPGLLKFGYTRRYDCLAIQVLDKDEIDFPFERAAEFADCESGRGIATAPQTVRANYQQGMNAFLANIREGLMRAGSDFLRVTTDTPLSKALGHYLHHRERMR